MSDKRAVTVFIIISFLWALFVAIVIRSKNIEREINIEKCKQEKLKNI